MFAMFPTKTSTFRARLDGKPYKLETHESLGKSSDSDSDTSEEESPTTRPRDYLMGQFCRRRAQTYHRMVHWGMLLASAKEPPP